MFRKTTIAAGLIALAAAAAPANATTLSVDFKGYGWNGTVGDRYVPNRDRDDHRYGREHNRRWQWVSPREARWILQDRGYHDIRFVDDGGRVYQVRARQHGATYRLLMNARNGQIISRSRI